MIPTTLGVALVVFLIFHAAPGDPATVMMGGGGSGELSDSSDVQARIERFKRKHGLDRALPVQFLDYIGPFNLSRDGVSWFSSPYTERKVEEETLESGATIEVGTPQPIAYLPGTEILLQDRLEEAREVLLDEAAGPSAWKRATQTILDAGDEGLPAFFQTLWEIQDQANVADGPVARVLAGVAEAGSFEPHPEANSEQVVRQAYAWYYTDGGGDRVPNTGENTFGGLLGGGFGKEMQGDRPVGPELWKRIKVSLPLSLTSVILAYLLAIPLGIFSVRNQGTKRDGMVTITLFVLFAIPTFWAGLMLVQLFGKTGLDLLPVLGLRDKDYETFSWWGRQVDLLQHCVLPVITLTYGSLAYLSRQMRAGMMDVIRQDFIRTARAKGLSENVVIYKHALRNSMIPVITLLASILPVLIGGSIIVEKVFDIPGMGLYAFDGLIKRDFNILMATTILVGIMTQLGILLSDITYSLVDPRIRHE